MERPIKDKSITNFELKIIKREDEKWIISNGRREFEFDKVISTVSIPELIEALDYVPKDIIKAVDNLNFNFLITGGIGVSRSKLNDLSWLYIPDNETISKIGKSAWVNQY